MPVKPHTARGLTTKKWRVNPAKITETTRDSFLVDIYSELNGYENKIDFYSALGKIMSKHSIKIVSQKLYDKHNLRFLDLIIDDKDGGLQEYNICFG